MTIEEAERLLYFDSEGNEVLEVLDLIGKKPIAERTEQLIYLLSHENISLRLDAAVLLTAWGIEEGVNYLENFLDRDAIEREGKYLCRNNEDDCTYDVIGESLTIFADNNPEKIAIVIRPLRKTLLLFHQRCFEFRMTVALSNSDISIYLVDNFKENIDLCLQANKPGEATELLQLYMKWGGARVLGDVVKYAKKIIEYPNTSYHHSFVAQILFVLPLEDAMSLVPLLQDISDSGVKYTLDKFLRSVKRKKSRVGICPRSTLDEAITSD
jgi:hypothetical protein